jgi:nucleoside-diphosphate-sugar epimerase
VEIDVGYDAHRYFRDIVTQFDLVVHAAAFAPNRKVIDTTPTAMPYNVGLDSAMFNWAVETAQPRVVYLSSCAVYPAVLQSQFMTKRFVEDFVGYDKFHLSEAFPFGIDPTPVDRYGWTKLIGEHMARATNEYGGTRVTVVRPFSGYGTDQSTAFPFRAFIERAKHREDPFRIWGDGNQVRDWIHIDDIVKAVMELVDAKVTAPVNLCTGTGTSMRQLVQKIIMKIPDPEYAPLIRTDSMESPGVSYRVGDPTFLHNFYVPTITLDEGIHRALKGE